MAAPIPHKDLSAFGRGWESHRKGLQLDENEFDLRTELENHIRWSDGWRQFKDSRVAVVTRFPKTTLGGK